ncbi:MAG TPA: lantibiotic dehydratase [Myxococcales bacterium LLY-WYZ-16_1]|nr:lantibiotic dehydratase [Myxococcales bacterium LLY-WYZ-16_1]
MTGWNARVPFDRGFSVWPQALLRSAGFSLNRMEPFSQSPLWNRAEEAVAKQKAAQAQIAVLARAIRDSHSLLPRAPKRLVRALQRGELPGELDPLLAGDGELTHELQNARNHLFNADEASAQYATALAGARRAERGELLRAWKEPRFRAAVSWQAPDLLDRFRPPDPSADDKRNRQRELLVYRYLQRFCTKNDTVGFFGPLGWAELRPGRQPHVIRPGSVDPAQKTVRLERWVVDALAEELTERVRPHLVPRLRGTLVWRDGRLRTSDGRTLSVPAPHARVLNHIRLGQTATELASQLAPEILASENDAWELLEELADEGVIRWRVEVPVWTLDPAAELRRLALEWVDEDDPVIRTLDDLVTRCDELAHAAQDPEALPRSLLEARRRWPALRRGAEARGTGGFYQARQPFYLDCLRDGSVKLSLDRAFADAHLGMAMVLESARWFTHRVLEGYRPIFREAWSRLRETTGPAVPFAQFMAELSPHFAPRRERSEPVQAALQELRKRWRWVLGDPNWNAAEIQLEATAVLSRADRAFECAGPGWPSARLHSPDVLWATPDGEPGPGGKVVLGEVHLAGNSLLVQTVLQQTGLEPLAQAAEDLGRPVLMPVQSPEEIHRACAWGPGFHGWHLERDTPSPAGSAVPCLRAGDAWVEARNGALWFCGGPHPMPIEAALDWYLSSQVDGAFAPFEVESHRPRIAIDRLVVARRAWRLQPSEIAVRGNILERIEGFQRRAVEERLPKRAFVSASTEDKPFFVDLTSPTSIANFLHTCRGAQRLVLTEMLPDHGDCWLRDDRGQPYASELRMVFVDSMECPHHEP